MPMENYRDRSADRIEVGVATHIGTKYRVNQDAYKTDIEQGIFLVADGIGGGPAGEVASRVAVNAAHAHLLDKFPEVIAEEQQEILRESVHAAHRAIKAAIAQVPAYRGMGTTLVMAWLPPGQGDLWVAHIGDSRAYLLNQGSLQQLTNDHTILNVVRQANMLPEDPERWPPRSLLSQSLGSGEMIAPDVNRFDLGEGDRVLLCTDGVCDALTDTDIKEIMSQDWHPQKMCEILIESALSAGADDNLTTLVVLLLATDQSGVVTKVQTSGEE
jgi:PPM family protein phosphatase